jgi:release factor glutamine methyltransferase
LKLLEWTSSYFTTRQVESPRASAEVLLARALNLERIDLYLRYDQPLCDAELGDFKALIKRRARMEPVAYILGSKEFWSMDLAVNPDVLIPRPETECLVEAALSLLADGSNRASKSILDMGTGSGAIILALASRQPQHIFYASDITRKAAGVARRNAKRHGLDGLIHFFVGDWLTAVKAETLLFDMIISNPPYIPSETVPRLQPEIYNYEPLLALDGDKDGLRCLRHIIGAAHHFLKPGATLLLEIGCDQKEAVRRIIDRSGEYDGVVFSKDYSGKDRVVVMHKRAG